MKAQPEYIMQCQICAYLEAQYKNVLFLTDTIASVHLTFPQQKRNQKVQKYGFKCPDLLILEPRNGKCGLLIELKTETPYKKNGEIKASDKNHLEEQEKYLKILSDKGYNACFSWSFEMTKSIIDEYLK